MHENRAGWRRWVVAIGATVAGPAAFGADIEPLDVEMSIQGAPIEAEGCTGGDWSMRWRGQLPGEGGSIQDILISYSSFDTTHETDTQGPAVTIDVKPVVCKDKEGNVVLTANISGGDRLVRGVVALKNDPVQRAPFFVFEVNDIGTCRINAPTMRQEIENYLLTVRTTDSLKFSPALAVSRTEMSEGFEKRFAISGQVMPMSPFCMGWKIVRGEITLRYKRRDEQPNVILAGCVNLARGGSTNVQARVAPTGGTLKFESDAASLLTVQPQALAARVTGATPGRGSLKASYTLNGRTATAMLPASSAEIVSINNGAAVPVMGLYGVDGKVSSKTYDLPLQTQPADAGDLLIFAAQNEAIVSVNTNRNSIAVQPVREGRTIIQAKTLCGEPIGPPVEIEIRTCDGPVHEQLKRRQEELLKREQEIVKRITRLTGDSEFQRAATEIKEDTINIATKTAELIAATLTGAQATAVKSGTATALSVTQLETAQNIWDVSNIISDANSGKVNSAALGTAVTLIGKWQVAALKSAIEAGLAAEQFGQDLGTLAGVVEQLELLEKQHDAARRDLYDVTRRLHQCEKLPPPPPLPPKKDKPRPQPVPDRDPQTPPVEIPVPPTQEPAPTPQTPPPSGPVDPPRAPASGGLCVRPADEPAQAHDLRTLIDATNTYKTTAQRAQEVFQNFAASLRAMEQATQQDPSAQIAAVKNFAAPFEAMTKQYFSLGEAAQRQQQRFVLCTERLPTQIELRAK